MISETILPKNQRLSEHEVYLLEKSPFPMEQKHAQCIRALQALEKEYKKTIDGKKGTS